MDATREERRRRFNHRSLQATTRDREGAGEENGRSITSGDGRTKSAEEGGDHSSSDINDRDLKDGS